MSNFQRSTYSSDVAKEVRYRRGFLAGIRHTIAALDRGLSIVQIHRWSSEVEEWAEAARDWHPELGPADPPPRTP